MVERYRRYMDSVIANARKPYYARGPFPAEPKDPLNRTLLPVYQEVTFTWRRRDAHWRITQARLAARAYEQEHGAAPPSPAALVPRYLPAVPQDPFAARPLACRRRGGRLLLYSRGPDGLDQGGRDLGHKVQRTSSGDIVTMKGFQPH